MIKFFKNLIKNKDHEKMEIDSVKSEYSDYEELILADICSDTSSEASYDSNIDKEIDIITTTCRRPNDVVIQRFNYVAELKRNLCWFRDAKISKIYYLHSVLVCIHNIGFYPPGMPYSKSQVFEFMLNYQSELSKQGIDVNVYRNYFGDMPLSKIFTLISKGPVYDNSIYHVQLDEYDQSLLHHAVRWNNYKLAKKLLNLEFDPNLQDIYGNTPIFNCCGHLHHRKSKMVYLLLKYGANPYHVLPNGKSLVDKALQKSNIKLVVLLAKKYGFVITSPKYLPKWARVQLQKGITQN